MGLAEFNAATRFKYYLNGKCRVTMVNRTLIIFNYIVILIPTAQYRCWFYFHCSSPITIISIYAHQWAY
jgi:hypothetical protein